MNQSKPQLLRRINIILAVLLFIVSALLIGYFYKTNKNNRQALNKETPPAYDEDISPVYSIKYPKDFFISYKDFIDLILAEKRLVDSSRLNIIPTIRINVRENVIPVDMELRTWLDGVNDPRGDLYSNTPSKLCFEFQHLISEITGFDNYSDYCRYHQVSNIQETTISGLPALIFDAQSMSGSSKHAIIRYQTSKRNDRAILLFDIYTTLTPFSDSLSLDTIEKAYQIILQTLQIKDPINPY
jgi:hypothetical protein